MQSISVFIFRRDFRLVDNKTLLALAKLAKDQKTLILPIFIFTKQQSKKENSFFNEKQFRFMIESIQDLQKQIKLPCFYPESNPETAILESIAAEYRIKHVAFNKDLTPFAKNRDKIIQTWCAQHKVHCLSNEDYTLHSVEKFKTLSPVFTPFMKLAKQFDIDPVQDQPNLNIFLTPSKKFKYELDDEQVDSLCEPHDPNVLLYSSRTTALEILTKLRQGFFKAYKTERDMTFLDKTTKLGVYMKFGLVSIREVYEAVRDGNGEDDTLISQLYWREYYFHVVHRNPKVLGGQVGEENRPLRENMEGVRWKEGKGRGWMAWCEGKTGFPFVDAGMRQLVQTGEVSNRVRMIMANFLTKNLLIDFREGEKFFAKYLIDYDPCQNSGGWQWCASTGVDSRPMRIFNCWLQQKNFDPDCVYIKKWVPELENVPVEDIVRWDWRWTAHKGVYYKPIVDHKNSSKQAIAMLSVNK